MALLSTLAFFFFEEKDGAEKPERDERMPPEEVFWPDSVFLAVMQNKGMRRSVQAGELL